MTTEDTTVIRYRTRPGTAEENQRRIEAVFAQLRAERPEGVRYQAYIQPDGTEFVHIVQGDSEVLRSLSSFKEFLAGDRIDGDTQRTSSTLIGIYP
ncbi:hypothetical protein ACFQ1S_19010 [Kibdelosporangium lantanae]|uniref:ABM domain-containing protein n=1 Tax=Kibdelosporangium lantanae TaxID=1497396 RepID=A0ABW3MCR4_9PSEU